MGQLKTVMEASRDWVSAEREEDLFERVADMLQTLFDVDAGMFVYTTFPVQGNASEMQIHVPWGLQCSASDLNRLIPDFEWLRENSSSISDDWRKASEYAGGWRQVFVDAGVHYVRQWNLTVQGTTVGALVLGSKTVPNTNVDDMSGCAIYISIVLEMFRRRRTAEHASCYDPLTNALNRRGFQHQLARLASEHKDLVVGILDINDFKEINDSLGHVKGDSILVDVAQTLQANLGGFGIVARYGGDEFVFALQWGSRNVKRISEQIRSWFYDKSYAVSLGCAAYVDGKEGSSWSSALSAADAELYQSKLAPLM